MAISALFHVCFWHKADIAPFSVCSAHQADIPVIGASRGRFRLTHGNLCCRSVFSENQSEESTGESNERLHER